MYQTFQQLTAKYDDFSAPAADVKIDGKSIMKSGDYALASVEADLDLKKANAAKLKLVSRQDESGAAFKTAVTKTIMLGSTIEVALGYGSSLDTVFYGYVSRLDFQQEGDGEKGAVLYAFDVRQLMMTSVRDKTYEGKMKAAIVKEVFSPYQKVCRKLVCALTGTIDGKVSQNDSDYHFIVDYLLASETPKKEFYVVGDTAYIDTPSADMLHCVTTLEKGSGLHAFSDSGSYLDAEIEIHGYDADQAKSVKAAASVQTKEKQKRVLTQKTIAGSGGISSEQEAKRIADRIRAELDKKAGGGTAECVGLPALLPGNSVKIVAKDMAVSKLFLIQGASHQFSGEAGYVTKLRFGKDELGDLLAGASGSKERAETALPKAEERGLMLGKVVDNWDDQHPGKLLIELGIGEQGKMRTEWIPYIVPYAGNAYGFCFRPEVGAQVAVGFLSGDKNVPLILGVVRDDAAKLPEEASGRENEVKELITKGGHKLIFHETKEAAVELMTAGGLKLVLNDKDQEISLSGPSGKNRLLISEKENKAEFLAETGLTLAAGSSKIELTDQGISIESGKIQIKASQQLAANGAKTTIEGNAVELKGNGSLKAESSGVAEIKGSLLKLN